MVWQCLRTICIQLTQTTSAFYESTGTMVLMFRLLPGWTMPKRSVCSRRELKQQVGSNFLSPESTKTDNECLCSQKGPTRKKIPEDGIKICPCGTAFCSLSFVWLLHFSQAPTQSFPENSREFPALLCTLWHSALEFNTFRIVGFPVLSTCFGSQTSEIPDVSGAAFQTDPHLRWAPILGLPKRHRGVGS